MMLGSHPSIVRHLSLFLHHDQLAIADQLIRLRVCLFQLLLDFAASRKPSNIEIKRLDPSLVQAILEHLDARQTRHDSHVSFGDSGD